MATAMGLPIGLAWPRWGLALVLTLPAAGTQAGVPAAATQPAPAAATSQSEPITFGKVVIKVSPSHSYGRYSWGACWATHPLVFSEGQRVDVDDAAFEDAFRQEATGLGYPLAGNPDSLFVEDPSASRARFMVSALITGFDADVCYPRGNLGDFDIVKGKVSMQVEWQVYSTFEKKVTFTSTTEGSYEASNAAHGHLQGLLRHAFTPASEALLQDPAFRKLVAIQADPGPDSGVSFTPLTIASRSSFRQEFTKHSAEVVDGVVTIQTGDAHGSGFFISRDGYLLTDSHVVAGSDKVKVILSSGIELMGTVVRQAPHRDVALVKVDGSGFKALPLRLDQAGVGEKVFAIGSPLDLKLASTVSSGVVSGYRVMDGLNLIQSDVGTHPGNSGGPLTDADGNVIGLCESGRTDASGVNFFNPIGDVLTALNIVPGKPHP